MAEVKRYVYWCRATHGHAPLEQDDGEFVLYEDYERLRALLEKINMLACYASEENTDARETVLLEIGKLARGERSPDETAGEQPQPRISVTLTAEEFEAMVAKEKKLTAELEEADAINGQGVNREVALERANATLVARVNRLRDRIGKAYDALAAAKAEDVQPENGR